MLGRRRVIALPRVERSPLTTVDQQKTRRTRTGHIAHDPALTQPGYTLFAPTYGDGTVYLVAWTARRRTPGICRTALGSMVTCSTTATSSKAARSWRTSSGSRRGPASRRSRARGGLAWADRLGGAASGPSPRCAPPPQRQRYVCVLYHPRLPGASRAVCAAPKPTAS